MRCTSSNISCHHCHLLVIMSCFSTLTMSRDLRIGRSQESHGVTTCHSVSASKTGRRCYEMQNVQPRMKTRKIYRFGLQYKFIYIYTYIYIYYITSLMISLWYLHIFLWIIVLRPFKSFTRKSEAMHDFQWPRSTEQDEDSQKNIAIIYPKRKSRW